MIVRNQLGRRIILIADSCDTNIPLSTQERYFRRPEAVSMLMCSLTLEKLLQECASDAETDSIAK